MNVKTFILYIYRLKLKLELNIFLHDVLINKQASSLLIGTIFKIYSVLIKYLSVFKIYIIKKFLFIFFLLLDCPVSFAQFTYALH